MMFRKVLISISSVACCLGFVLFSLAEDGSSSSANLRELHAEKLSILEDIVSRYEFGYSKGKPVLEELLSAKHDLLRARLLAAESQADRIKLQELIVENRGRLVEARIAAHQLGNNTEIDILAARVEHIDARIELQHVRSDGRGTR
jgi:hypothetical protein